MNILGIETSCDETAATLLQVTNFKLQILSNIVSSQVKIHQKYGGIVPEVAARKHVELIIPIMEKALRKMKDKIDLLTVTTGPGLITSLMVGTETAKTLSYLWQKPIIGINHLEGHIYSNWLSYPELFNSKKIFPTVCLIVSGGHTELVLTKDHSQYQLLGRTRDDAAGEAFDKVAKILSPTGSGIGYPGGPIISKYAKNGNSNFIEFPRPMIDDESFDFSFSGLKTAVLYEVQNLPAGSPHLLSKASEVGKAGKKKPLSRKYLQDICASFQKAVVDVLVTKAIRAAKKYKVKSIMLSGGVSANIKLRNEFKKQCKKEGVEFYCPKLKYTGDNAAMIAMTGYFKHQKLKTEDQKKSWQRIKPQANQVIV